MKTIVQTVAHERHQVMLGGEKRSLSTVELVFAVIQRKALEGDLAAKRLLDQMRDEYSPQEANSKGVGCLVVPEGCTPETTFLPIEDVETGEVKKPGVPFRPIEPQARSGP